MDIAAGQSAKRSLPAVDRLLQSAPMLPIAGGLICGITLDESFAAGTLCYKALFTAAILGMLLPKWRRSQRQVMVLLASTAAGAMLHDARLRHLPANHIARYAADEPCFAELRGQIVQPPQVISPDTKLLSPTYRLREKTRFVLAVDSADSTEGWQPVTGLVRVTVSAPRADLAAGDEVRVFGKLFRPTRSKNPGQFEWARFLRLNGIYAGLSCEFAECVSIEPPQGGWFRRWLSKLRLSIRAHLHDGLLSDQADRLSLLDAMVIGQSSRIDPEIQNAFRVTGTAHFLALSGLHVGMLAMFLWFLSRCLNISRQWGAAGVIAVLLCYLLIVEPRPSVWRATIIVTVFCAGIILQRPVSILNNLCLAAVILLSFDPMQLFLAGFQMSFMVTLGVLYVTPVLTAPLARVLPRRPRHNPNQLAIGGAGLPRKQAREWRATRMLVRVVWYTLAVSLAAWLVGSPLSAYHFNRFYVFGGPFSALLMPLVFLMMFTAFIKLLVGGLWATSALVLGPLLQWTTALVVGVVAWLAQMPAAAVEVPAPSNVWMMLYYAGLMLWVLSAKVPSAHKRRCRRLVAAAAVVLCAGAIPSLMSQGPTNELRVTALAVGPGTATIIELPDGRACLYDAGSSAEYDVGAFAVVPALRERRIQRIAAAIISHANYDHYSGIPSVAEVFPIQQIVITPHFQRSAAAGTLQHQFLQRLYQRAIPIMHLTADGPNQLQIPVVATEVLWPREDVPDTTAANDRSLVLRLAYAGQRILLTGDIDRYAQEQLLDSGLDLTADILMLPHHGSVNPATSRFLEAVNPRIVICSSHRRKTVPPSKIEQLTRRYLFLNTADDGAICVTLGTAGLSVSIHDQGAERLILRAAQ